MLTIIGDVHGYLQKVINVLRTHDLIDADEHWQGGDAELWFLGDYFDRGPDGIDTIELVMRLQREAAEVGGRVEGLLGNHELHLLAALKLGDEPAPGTKWTFNRIWSRNGGQSSDMERMTDEHIAWLESRPMMGLAGSDHLVMHADNLIYLHYGETIDEVNEAFREYIQDEEPEWWSKIVSDLSDRHYFRGQEGPANARLILDTFGGERIVHGHVPISTVTKKRPPQVTEPLVYAEGLAVNVDPGLYLGGPGFAYTTGTSPEQTAR